MHPEKGTVESVATEDGEKKTTETRRVEGSFDVGEVDKVDFDDVVLQANGHRVGMPRQFNWISALGLGFSITNSWIGYLVRDALNEVLPLCCRNIRMT